MAANAVVAQSGGPTAVINQSLVGVIEAAQKAGHIDKILGARHGVRGMIEDDFIDLSSAPAELLERIAQTPAAGLGSSRDKPDEEYCKKVFQHLQAQGVKYMFYIGGNDSADTARIVNEVAAQAGYELHVFHVPKTIDNDLRVHDHTPGYGSAAKFVASACIGDNFDNKSLPGVKINIIMGRNAGFLTASAALGRKYEDDGPHLIYMPERPVTKEQFIADVQEVYDRLGRCLVVASEGMMHPDGKTYAEMMNEDLPKDDHGNVQLAGSGALGDYLQDAVKAGVKPKDGGKLRVRADTLGYMQRSFPGYVSEVDAAEARMVGNKAVEYSADDANKQGSVVMTCDRAGDKYAVKVHLEPLENVARLTRHMPDAFIEGHNNVSQTFIDYALPLVGELPTVGSISELD
ncbi:MAG: 6-phosphofructokinase [Planctomycetota bacterium]